jgi:hypothetical protein
LVKEELDGEGVVVGTAEAVLIAAEDDAIVASTVFVADGETSPVEVAAVVEGGV